MSGTYKLIMQTLADEALCLIPFTGDGCDNASWSEKELQFIHGVILGFKLCGNIEDAKRFCDYTGVEFKEGF